MNEVFESEYFSTLYKRLEKFEQDWIEKVKNQLKINLKTGQILRYSWFREKKLGNKRLFYVVNFESKKALIVGFGTKKQQKKTIRYILRRKKYYLDLIK